MVVKLTWRKSVMVLLWFVIFDDLSIKFDCFVWFVGYVNDLHKLFSLCPTHRVYYVCCEESISCESTRLKCLWFYFIKILNNLRK